MILHLKYVDDSSDLNLPGRSFYQGSAEMNLTSSHEDADSIPGLAQWA